MTHVSDFHKQVCIDVERSMNDFYNNQISQAKIIDNSYERLWKIIQQVTMGGGKRIRPYLTLLTASLGGNNYTGSELQIAVSQELLHSALLMHDDIIDRDTVRHGQKNVNGIYGDIYSDNLSKDEAVHFSHGTAILSGDLLISSAYKLVIDSEIEDSNKQKILGILSGEIFEVAGGELMDVESTFMNGGVYNPLTIYRYKTASYSFIGPINIGTVIGNLPTDTAKALLEYAENLGIAYQLEDDVIGVFGDEIVTGKSSSCDIREAKNTFLINNFLESAGAKEIKYFRTVFGNKDANDDNLQGIRNLIESSGAKAATIQAVSQYSKKARVALGAIPASPQKNELLKLLDILMSRDH